MSALPCVIIGAGEAAAHAVEALRREGFDAPIRLIGEEDAPPYRRPPLSKAYLAGALNEARLYVRPRDFYAAAGVELRTGTRAVAIERDAKRVRLADGSFVPYGVLLLATGARVRRLSVPGADLPCVRYLRTLDDATRLRDAFRADGRLVVVGGGYIGLEVAASAAQKGMRVHLLEAAPRLLSRTSSEPIADALHRRHIREGVEIITGAQVVSFEARGAGCLVRCAGAEPLEADLVVIGIGIEPNTALAEEAGLAVADGIFVDAHARTSDASIFAAGDCASHPSALYNRRLRLESVQNAIDQAKAAAAAISGKEKPYTQTPWFWSDQYDVKLQIAGLPIDATQTCLRGDPKAESFSVFHMKEGVVRAVEAFNRPAEFMWARRALGDAPRLAREVIRDTSVPPKEWKKWDKAG